MTVDQIVMLLLVGCIAFLVLINARANARYQAERARRERYISIIVQERNEYKRRAKMADLLHL